MDNFAEYTKWLRMQDTSAMKRAKTPMSLDVDKLKNDLIEYGIPVECLVIVDRDLLENFRFARLNRQIFSLVLEFLGASAVREGCYAYGNSWVDFTIPDTDFMIYTPTGQCEGTFADAVITLPMPSRSKGLIRVKFVRRMAVALSMQFFDTEFSAEFTAKYCKEYEDVSQELE